MKAVKVVPDAAAPQLIWDEAADISCGADEVLVDVRATAVNRADLLQAQGLYPPPPGETEIRRLTTPP